MCFADRSGIGRAQIREEPVESLFTILYQWHSDLSEGFEGRDSILNILNFQLIHSCCSLGVVVGRCTLCSAVLSVDRKQVSEGSCSCMERCSAALLGDRETEHSSPLRQELWLTFTLHKVQTAFLMQCGV